MIDNATLMIAVAFSSGALMVTLLLGWLNARRDNYLVSWAIGMGFVVIALVILGLRGDRYDLPVQAGPFTALILGTTFVYAAPLVLAIALCLAGLLSTNIPFILGHSGLGTIALNLFCAILMVLSGYQYWAGRAESPAPMITGAVLFMLTGISFLCCALVLIMDGAITLNGPPNNWAEQFNSIMAIVGLTGIGALSLTLSQSRATRRHREEARTDALTGLLNRRALFGRFGAADLPAGTAVLMFDIDHFKRINDRHGHAGGDAALLHFGAILRRNTGSPDSVARIGGEEFCAILRPMPIDHAKALAERIRADFEAQPAQLLNEPIPATVSIGIATSGANESFSSVLNRADDALYLAKGNGRNRVTVAPLRLIA
jgi:diguanylate cyclase (GGDEF)-like protein